MANPTNPRPRRFVQRTGRDVWPSGGPFAYLESIQAAGTVAAPLLAGASFTLVALVLQSPAPFGRWQDVSLSQKKSIQAPGPAPEPRISTELQTRELPLGKWGQSASAPVSIRPWRPADQSRKRSAPVSRS
jgi:hypothetical protein